MSMYGPYEFTDGNGRRFKVEVILNPRVIAKALVQKAKESATGVATACAGGVTVIASESWKAKCLRSSIHGARKTTV
jgi:hypothetical protein